MMTVGKTTMGLRSYLLTVLLVTWLNPSIGALTVTLSPPNPKAGDDVTFIVTGIEGGNIRFSDLYKGTKNYADNQIFRFTNSRMTITKGKQYIEGAEGFANGSMVIRNVQTAHSGIYTVDIQTNILLQAKVQLIVQGHQSNDFINVTLSPLNPNVGDDVTFIVSGVNGNIRFSDWYNGTENNVNNQILWFSNSRMNKTKGKQYIEGAEGFANGSMLIRNAQTTHSGIYTVYILTKSLFQAQVQLVVQVLHVPLFNDVFNVFLSPPNPKVGDTVTFIVYGVKGNIGFSDWYKGTENKADNHIFRFTNAIMGISKGKQYIEGADGFANGSMVIRNVQTTHSGIYTVNIQTNSLLQANGQLVVQGKGRK